MLYVVTSREKCLHFLPKHGVCAEVGVFTGAFSELIDGIIQPTKLHLIDIWAFNNWVTFFGPDEQAWREIFIDWFKTLVPDYDGGDPSPHYSRMYEKLKEKYKDDARIEIHQGASQEIGLQFPENYFDFVYLDASHKYNDVLQDLYVYSASLKDGGIIMGDDFYDVIDRPSEHKFIGTVQAVSQFVKRTGYKCLAVTGPSASNFLLYKRRSNYVEKFLDNLYRSDVFFVELSDSQLANYCAKTFSSSYGSSRRFVPSFHWEHDLSAAASTHGRSGEPYAGGLTVGDKESKVGVESDE